MMRAIRLAKKAEGKTFPNPLVGAVILKGKRIVGEGYHKKVGSPHAEIAALGKARVNARGADLYINLEPCAHYGKTPPCVRSIVNFGIKKVYAAMKDPNPLVNGKGFKVLRKNGITVRTGLCRREAEKLNRDYVKRIRKTGQNPELLKK